MSILKDLQYGISSYSNAIDFIFRNKLAWAFLIPLALNILLFAFGISLVGGYSESIFHWLEESIAIKEWDFWGAEFLANTLGFIIWLLLKIFFFLLFAFVGGYVVLILLSPILAYLSERTEKIYSGSEFPFSWMQLLKDAWRGILLAIRNFILEGILAILLFLLSFVPIFQLITTPALFIISAYYYGFSFIDYTAERRKMNRQESIRYIRKNKGLAIGNGALFAGSLMIPIIGVSISGFMAIISSVAATLAILKKEEKEGITKV